MTKGNETFKKKGLNHNQFIYLIRVCENPGLFQNELADLIRVDRTTSFRAIQKLEKNGFIERRDDLENKKIKRLYPTIQGLDVYPALQQYELESAQMAVKGLSEGEQQLLSELLEKVIHNFENPSKL